MPYFIHVRMHASNLSSISPPNSTTCKGPDNRHGEDTMFDVLLSQKPSILFHSANRKLPIILLKETYLYA